MLRSLPILAALLIAAPAYAVVPCDAQASQMAKAACDNPFCDSCLCGLNQEPWYGVWDAKRRMWVKGSWMIAPGSKTWLPLRPVFAEPRQARSRPSAPKPQRSILSPGPIGRAIFAPQPLFRGGCPNGRCPR